MWSDMPAAVLTDRQRKFLHPDRGDDVGSDRGERAARARIRDRLRASILDLQLIASELSLDDIDEALAEPDESEWPSPAYPPVANAIPSLAALIYLRNRDAEVQADENHDGWKTEIDVAEGVKRAFGKLQIELEGVDVTIEIQRGGGLEDPGEGDLVSLTREQLTQLHRSGMIGGDEFARAWQAKRDEDGGAE